MPWSSGLCTLFAALLAAHLVACTPALDWRDVRPSGGAVQLLFPCKPSGQERQLLLGGHEVTLSLYACAASEQTWGLAYADMGDATRVAAALDELLQSAARNLGAAEAAAQTLSIPGASDSASNRRALINGRLPDGTVVRMHCFVFARGTRVYQLSVLGPALDNEAVQTFVDSIRFSP